MAGVAPQGLLQRTDPFAQAPYISYLQSHAGLYRVYSYDSVLMPDYAGVFGLYDLGTFGGLNVASFHTFAKRNLDSGFLYTVLASNEWLREPSPPAPAAVDELHRNLRFYDFLGVKYFVTSATSQSDFTSYDYFRLVYQDSDARVYENPGAMPRAFLVNKFRTTESLDLAQSIVSEPSFNLTTTVTLNGPLLDAETAALNGSITFDNSSAQIVSYEPNRVLIDVNAQHPALLILTDVYYPGWNSRIDGKPEQLFQADGLVRAVFVPAGNHKVEFTYLPLSFEVGFSITLISAVIALFIVLRGRGKQSLERVR